MAANDPDILGQQWHQLFDDLSNETGIRVGSRTMPGTTSHGLHLPDSPGLQIASSKGGILHVPGWSEPGRRAEFMTTLPIDTAPGPGGVAGFEGGFSPHTGAPELTLHTPQGSITTSPEQFDPSIVVNENLGIYEPTPERILSAIPSMLAHSAEMQSRAPMEDRRATDGLMRALGQQSRGGRFLSGQISYLGPEAANPQTEEDVDRAAASALTFPRGYDFRKRQDIDQYEED
jgi:hypothetical protein